MAKKATKTPVKKDNESAVAGIKTRLTSKPEDITYQPDSVERVARKYIKQRSGDMIDYRKGLGIEGKWKEADEEYIPHELDFGTTRKRFETDQDTGLRSRMVPVGDATQQWRQASSAPTLLSKIQTAISIIIDQQPEADLVALLKKYSATTELAYALWKRNWQITNAKEKLKLIVFDLFKYGWAAQRTFPRIVKYPKRVLMEADNENPENDRYQDKDLTWFNDVDRERLDPFRTWIDELAKPYDPYTTNEVYYEKDYSYDAFIVEFGKYPNSKYVKQDSQYIRSDESKKGSRTLQNQESMKRKDVVTVGFFESRHKDLYGIYIPKDDIILYLSPLPNDDGYLSVNHTMLLLRKSTMPYGVSLWEIIRQNKTLYDKMKNMGMDQLVLSIMKFGFFAGTNTALGDGKIDIIPGQARQLTSSTGKAEVNWMEIPGPGEDFWKGLGAIETMMDDESGITAMLEGQDTPGQQTLGELLHRQEASLKRLKVPVENIAWLVEQDAYLTLSWMSQVYAIPTVMEFADEQELAAFNKENQINHVDLFGTPQEDGTVGSPFEAHYLPQLALHLEDRNGQLTQSKKSQFFDVGKDITPSQLKWRGIFKVIPRSIIDTSQELVKATKMEVFNMIMPLLQFPPELVARPLKQILKINEEDPQDWLPDTFIQFLDGQEAPQGMPGTPPQPTQPGQPPQGPQAVPPGPNAPQPQAGPSANPQSMQAGAGTAPLNSQKVVPGPNLADVAGKISKGFFKRRA